MKDFVRNMNEITIQDILSDGSYIEDLSDGQFTGSFYSERWNLNGVDYEVIFDNGEVFDFKVYTPFEDKLAEYKAEKYDVVDLIYRLRKRAEIRRSISSRKSVKEGRPDRISDLLEEAAGALESAYEI